MVPLLLRLLLILCLVSNGVALPWAEAHAGHADSAAAAGVAAERTGACGHDSAMDAVADADADADEPAAPGADACCNAADCGCGCVLPLMMTRTAANVPAMVWAIAPRTEPATRVAHRRVVPPLRPPAS